MIIPVRPLSRKGHDPACIKTIGKVEKRQINPALKVDGVFAHLVDGRTNLARQTGGYTAAELAGAF